MLLSDRETRRLCEKVLGRVKADDAIVSVRSALETNQRFANANFTTNGRAESVSIGLALWRNGRKGSASTSDISSSGVDALIQQAVSLAELAPVDQEYVSTLSQQEYQRVNGFAPSALKVSLANRAKSVQGLLDQCEKAEVVPAGLHRTNAGATGSLTKNGNFDYERSSVASLAITARTPDSAASGCFARSVVDPDRLNIERVASEAIRKAQQGRNAEIISPGVYPVILEAQAVRDLLVFLPGAFPARAADEGRSAMSAPGGKTRLGEQYFDKRLNFYSDPWNKEVPGSQSAPEGIPAQKLHLVRNGVVENLIYSRYWAKEKDVAPTPGPTNLILESSEKPTSLEEMIASSERALLVTRLWYIRMVNPRSILVTGLTRDGVWLVEKGKIKHPVRNFRFNQSIMQMLAQGNVEQIGFPERVGGAGGATGAPALYPPLKLAKFHFTSASEAV